MILLLQCGQKSSTAQSKVVARDQIQILPPCGGHRQTTAAAKQESLINDSIVTCRSDGIVDTYHLRIFLDLGPESDFKILILFRLYGSRKERKLLPQAEKQLVGMNRSTSSEAMQAPPRIFVHFGCRSFPERSTKFLGKYQHPVAWCFFHTYRYSFQC